MTAAPATSPTRATLLNVRLTFPALFEPKAVQGSTDAKFSATALFGKDHPQLGEIKAKIMAAATGKWGAKAADVLKQLQAADKLCLRDGDGKSDYDGYAGNLYINASNKIRPLAIGGGPDGRGAVTASDGKFYSGCYVNMIVDFWAQDNQYGKRVNASLLGVQFLKDGDRLAGGGIAAADDFAPIPQEAAQQAAATGAGAAGLF